MLPRLMRESLKDYITVMRGRYARRSGKQARSALLDEFRETAGYERKHANKVLRGQHRRGSPGIYRPEDAEVLKGVWLAAGQPRAADGLGIAGVAVLQEFEVALLQPVERAFPDAPPPRPSLGRRVSSPGAGARSCRQPPLFHAARRRR